MKKEIIGPCTLYLGDCLEILPEISKKIDMIFSDPPYGMRKKGIVNDNLNYDSLLEFNKRWIIPSFSILKNGGSWYCWGLEQPLMDIYSEILKPMIKNKEITWRNFITWNKGLGQGQKSSAHRQYARCHENCLFVTKGNRSIKKMSSKADFIDEFTTVRKVIVNELNKAGITNKLVEKLIGSPYLYGHWTARASWRFITEKHYKVIQNYCKENNISAFTESYTHFENQFQSALKEWNKNRAYFDNIHDNMSAVWDIRPVSANSPYWSESLGHPAQKPLALCSRAVKTSCPKDGVVLDPFMGSGSVGEACVNLQRRFIGIEIEEKYFDVACKRIELAARQGQFDFEEG